MCSSMLQITLFNVTGVLKKHVRKVFQEKYLYLWGYNCSQSHAVIKKVMNNICGVLFS